MPEKTVPTMRLGIALGGGGAKGLAHVGALKVLAQEGVHFDVVAGTSIGALVGAAYAAGKLDAFEEEVRAVRLTEIPGILSPAWSFGGLFSGKNVLEKLDDVLETDDFKDLGKRFAAISTDLETAEIVVHTEGSLSKAIRSSISIPGIFTPVRYGESLLVDGGVMEPVPVQAARNLGASLVLAIDLFSNRAVVDERRSLFPLWPRGMSSAMKHIGKLSVPRRKKKDGKESEQEKRDKEIPRMMQLLERSFAVSQIHITRLRLKENPADILLTPAVSDVGVLDFHRAQAIIARGEEYARSQLPRILEQLERAKSEH